MTQSQLQELLESEQIRTLIEGAEERGSIEHADLEAVQAEQDLSDSELEELKLELMALGHEITAPAGEGDADDKKKE